MTKNAVTKKSNTQVAVPDDIDLFEDAGMGNENVGQEDVIIPRLKIAQSMSKEIKKAKAEYIEGLEEGGIFNKATGAVYEQPLLLVPVAYHRRYVEWVPLDQGGGLVNADHPASIMDQVNENGLLPNGNEIVDTPEHFCLIIDREAETIEAVVLSMASSGQKVSRMWNTLIRNLKITNPKTGQKVNPARFYGCYEFTTVPESNDKGDWFNWKIKYHGPTLELGDLGVEAYREARNLHEMVKAGEVKAEVEDPNENATPTTDAM